MDVTKALHPQGMLVVPQPAAPWGAAVTPYQSPSRPSPGWGGAQERSDPSIPGEMPPAAGVRWGQPAAETQQGVAHVKGGQNDASVAHGVPVWGCSLCQDPVP